MCDYACTTHIQIYKKSKIYVKEVHRHIYVYIHIYTYIYIHIYIQLNYEINFQTCLSTFYYIHICILYIYILHKARVGLVMRLLSPM